MRLLAAAAQSRHVAHVFTVCSVLHVLESKSRFRYVYSSLCCVMLKLLQPENPRTCDDSQTALHLAATPSRSHYGVYVHCARGVDDWSGVDDRVAALRS